MTRPGARELVLAAVSLLLALGVAELACSAFLPLASRRSRYARLRHVIQYDPAFVVEDPELGWSMRPHLDRDFENPEEGGFVTRIRTNSAGYRDDEASLEDPQVLVLGDSFAFGWGVDEAEAFPARLEAALGRRVLNLGVSGYGTVQELVLLRRVSSRIRLAGKQVVLQTFFNDLEDNLRTGFAVTPWIEDLGPPVRLGFPGAGRLAPWMSAMVETAIDFAPARRSHLAYLAARLAGKVARLGQRPTRRQVPDPTETEEQRVAIFTAALAALRDHVATAGGELLVVHVPAPAHFDGGAPSGLARLQSGFAATGVKVLDAAAWLGAKDYWPLDGHWNAAGHAAAAAALARELSPAR